MATSPTFEEKVNAWREAAPERAARQAAKSPLRRTAGKLYGLAVLALLLLLVVVVLVVLIGAAVSAWKPIAIFLGTVLILAAIAKALSR